MMEILALPLQDKLALLSLFLFSILLFLSYITRRAFIQSLNKKHILITGGSSGIGLAIAKRALVQGADVTLVSRNIANLKTATENLARELRCSPERIRCEVADVGNYDAISSAIARSSLWKPIDVLICNAGLTRGGYLENASVQDLELTIRTNLMGTVNALHAALPDLKRRSQRHPTSVVIMASLASLFFMYGHSVYTASKYALRGLAEGLRFELLPYNNIKVSLICPGFTNTPFLEEADREQEICRVLKWVNLYSRRFAESADSVAQHTMRAIKTGTFLVTTNPLGIALATVGRGFVPADSLPKFLVEMILFLPVKIASSMITAIYRWIIRRKVEEHCKKTDSETISVTNSNECCGVVI